MLRYVVWFSCGAASAAAAKLAVDTVKAHVEVYYCDTLAYEHPDNVRFMSDIEKWIGRKISILKSPIYTDIYDIFKRKGYIKNAAGAPCTTHLKRDVRKLYSDLTDTHIFGLTYDEQDRIKKFEQNNPRLPVKWILLEHKLTKYHCKKMLYDAGIKLPAMYALGYKNNNCIGCVKGGIGYWNKIRRDFPEAFNRMAKLERELGYALLTYKGKKCYLDELPPHAGKYEDELDVACGPLCMTPET